MTVCDTPGCTEHYGCELRAKGPQFSRKGFAHRVPHSSDPNKVDWIGNHEPSWEKGIAGEHRRDGSFMPYLDGEGQMIRVKQFGEQRRELTETRTRLAQEAST